MVGDNFHVKWPSNIEYKGQVSNSKLNGLGEITFPEGEIEKIKGIWKDDMLIQSDLLTMRDGSTATNF